MTRSESIRAKKRGHFTLPKPLGPSRYEAEGGEVWEGEERAGRHAPRNGFVQHVASLQELDFMGEDL